MKFVKLQKGTFYMGGGGYEVGRKTVIKEDFEIAIHTVTQGQWQAVMGSNPSYFSRSGKGKDDLHIKNITAEELTQFPVECVSWNDAQDFIKKLNDRERGKGWTYRLPSEAEWEYACRGGATTEEECSYDFYFDKPTNDLSSAQANFGNFARALKGPRLERTTKVGSYPPNKVGLYDMHGNVCQWCADLVASADLGAIRNARERSQKSSGTENEFTPPAPSADDGIDRPKVEDGNSEDGKSGRVIRVIRGGSWYYGITFCSAASRNGFEQIYSRDDLGFRLVAVPSR